MTIVILTEDEARKRRDHALAMLRTHRCTWEPERFYEEANRYTLTAEELALWNEYEDMGYLLAEDVRNA